MARKYRGVRIRGPESIEISFMFEGRRCREIIKMPPTLTNIKYASRRRSEILSKIERNTFQYSIEFPASKSRLAQAHLRGSQYNVRQALNNWLIDCEMRCEYSTIRGYNSAVKHYLEPRWGHYELTEMNRPEILAWIQSLQVSPKRINNTLIPLRQILSQAHLDGLIDRNPMERIKNLKVVSREPRPFSNSEIQKILDCSEGSVKNALQFGFWSGLRTSELLGLKWSNICLDTGWALIDCALVHGKLKHPKTTSSRRKINLHAKAVDALRSQHNIRSDNEFVFHDPKSGDRWDSDQPFRKRAWIPTLKKAGIEYRECYQMRHTFATQMLIENRNPLWLAAHMGHRDWGMIRKVYARWINND